MSFIQPTGHIDLPNLASFVRVGDTILVSGWAIGTNGPLEIRFDGFEYGTVGFNEVRKDVVEHYGIDSKNVGFSFELKLNQVPGLHQITISTADSGTIIASTQFVILEKSVSSSKLAKTTPITVTSIGRSGSTLLMQTLFTLPEVAGHREYPFETRIVQYWLNMFRILQGLPVNDYSEEMLLNFTGNIGANPFAEFKAIRRNQLESLTDDINFIKHRIELDHSRISSGACNYLAEKTSVYSLPLCKYLFGNSRDIYLTRDVRFIAASIKKFSSKNVETVGFSYEGNFTSYILGPLRNGLVLLYESIKSNPSCLVLPYISLVTTPYLVSEKLAGFIFESEDISTQHHYQERLFEALSTPKVLSGHVTSGSVLESLDSWEFVLDEDERLCCRVIEEQLKERFGELFQKP